MDDAARFTLVAQFEALGAEKVREKVAAKHYGEAKLSIAQAWLRSKDAADQRDTTERGLSAADRSATASEGQAKYAMWAFYLSVVAIAISVLALIVAAAQAAATGMS